MLVSLMRHPMLERFSHLSQLLNTVKEWLNTPLFTLGSADISILSISSIIIAIALLIWLANWLQKAVEKWILKRYHLESGVSDAVSNIIKYVVIVLGFFIVLESSGIDLSSLQVLAGALGVGIGFGLQNITNNFISGIIILMERPIKVGDRIEVGSLEGDVVSVAARATTIVTNDNVSVIVPNSEFISKQVVNWSHNDRMVRFRFQVGVSYKEDPEEVKRVLLEVAKENDGVLKSPVPDVLFDSFGDSSLNFILRVWTNEYTDRPRVLKSQLYYAIFKKFEEANISIPYPQRDVHIKSEHPKEIIFSKQDQVPKS